MRQVLSNVARRTVLGSDCCGLENPAGQTLIKVNWLHSSSKARRCDYKSVNYQEKKGKVLSQLAEGIGTPVASATR